MVFIFERESMVGGDVKADCVNVVVASRHPSESVLREFCLSMVTSLFRFFKRFLRRKDFDKFSALFPRYLLSRSLQSRIRSFSLPKSSRNFTKTILNSMKRTRSKLSVLFER